MMHESIQIILVILFYSYYLCNLDYYFFLI